MAIAKSRVRSSSGRKGVLQRRMADDAGPYSTGNIITKVSFTKY
jgi:hypothetical protein